MKIPNLIRNETIDLSRAHKTMIYLLLSFMAFIIMSTGSLVAAAAVVHRAFERHLGSTCSRTREKRPYFFNPCIVIVTITPTTSIYDLVFLFTFRVI